MTRFVYIADTHLGAAPMGYHQQPGHPERLRDIVHATEAFMASGPSVDFVLHGGDMVDAATDANIIEATGVFDLGVPVHLCLGNHDLTRPDALQRWMDLAPAFFPGATPDYTITTSDCVIHVAPNHWDDEPHYWSDTQRAHFRAEQRRRLERSLDASAGLPHILLTHSPVHGLPSEQTGAMHPLHGPENSFTDAASELAAAHPNLRCVLGAHTHMNMCVELAGVTYVTVSALVETPYELKVFEVGPDTMTMTTVALGERTGVDGEYDDSKAYVQGRTADRSFTIRL